MLEVARLWPVHNRHTKVATKMASVPAPKEMMKPGCQISAHDAVAVTLNSSAGRQSHTTILLISEAAWSPSRLVLRQMKPARMRAKMGKTIARTVYMTSTFGGDFRPV
ncbi:hypothetical protein D3C79_969520 [compost metagenome]